MGLILKTRFYADNFYISKIMCVSHLKRRLVCILMRFPSQKLWDISTYMQDCVTKQVAEICVKK